MTTWNVDAWPRFLKIKFLKIKKIAHERFTAIGTRRILGGVYLDR